MLLLSTRSPAASSLPRCHVFLVPMQTNYVRRAESTWSYGINARRRCAVGWCWLLWVAVAAAAAASSGGSVCSRGFEYELVVARAVIIEERPSSSSSINVSRGAELYEKGQSNCFLGWGRCYCTVPYVLYILCRGIITGLCLTVCAFNF